MIYHGHRRATTRRFSDGYGAVVIENTVQHGIDEIH